jgi:predicted dehydrogenase
VTRLGQAGLGAWGKNLARNFDELADLAWLCDADESRRHEFADRYPQARITGDFDDLLADPDLEAVVVATPVPTHYELAKLALEAGKHVFVEKPPAMRTQEMEELCELAEQNDLVLMPGHLLLYHPGVNALKRLIEAGDLGEVRYIYSNRLNLGKLRRDENALWSLGAHDVSVILRLAAEEPYECRALGESYVNEGVEDVVFCYLRFPSGLAAHMHLSWLDPHKERRFTVVGSKRMATFDDMELERKLSVYDKGFDEDYSSYGEYIARSGDIFSPHVSNEEPLRIECRHFLECVRDGVEPRSGGESGLRVVRVLEALERSLRESSRAAPV